MTFNMKQTCLATVACGLAASSAFAHEGLDVSPYVQDGKIIVGGFDDTAGTLQPTESVFLLELEAAEGFGIDAPALNLQAGAGFDPGVLLGMNFTSELFFWDGTGDVDFAPTADGSRIRIFQGIDTGVYLNGDAPAGDYYWLRTNSNGLGHEHANSQYYGPDGNGTNVVGTVTPGIYYALGQVLDEAGNLTPSDEIALLYNTGGETFEAAHEEAAAYLRTSLVPEPTSLALLAIGGLVSLRRRSR